MAAIHLLSVSTFAAANSEEEKAWPLVAGLGPDDCGPLFQPARHGPFDYRNPPPAAIIGNVEAHHFNQRLRAMRQGKDKYSPRTGEYSLDAGGMVAGGFSYTLHAFPNHARALQAMDEYSRKKGFSDKPLGAELKVECYFERAIRYAPNDVTVRYLYADFLEARGRQTDAEHQINLIRDEVETRPSLAYNIGLFYVKRGQFDKALEYARVAYGGGFNLPGLRNILIQKKNWDPIIDNVPNLPRNVSSSSATGQESAKNTQANENGPLMGEK